jgi:cell division protein FtsQ
VTDPRIHERRVKVAREKGRLRRRVIIASLVVVAGIIGSLFLLHSSFFGARHVVVEGADHTPVAAVLSASGLEKAPPLVDLSASGIKSRLEALPWVKSATVVISFPQSVRIELKERVPVAVSHAASGGWVLVDRTGRVLAHLSRRPGGYPYVADPAGAPLPGKWLGGREDSLSAMAAVMPESMVRQVSELTWGHPGAEAILSDGRVALFGSADQLEQKFVSLATVLARADLVGIKVIDLRVPSDPALLTKASGPIVSRNAGG